MVIIQNKALIKFFAEDEVIHIKKRISKLEIEKEFFQRMIKNEN